MNQFKHAKWWRSYLDKLWQKFWKLKFMKNQALELHSPLPKSFKVCKERTMENRKTEWRKKRTAAVVFFRTFGVLPEVHFLHAIYHFKDLEVKNPTLQTCMIWSWNEEDMAFGSQLLQVVRKFRTTQGVMRNSHNTFKIRITHAWCEFSSVFSDSTLDIISFLILVTNQSQAFAFVKTI